MWTGRAILHLDMDAFFASVEQLDRPELRGKPVLVGHDGPRGVVAAASYEARPFGCHSAQPMAVARRACPHAVIVPVRGERYREVSHQVFAILDEFSPVVEPLSIDEAFLDLTGTDRLLGDPSAAAGRLKDRIREKVKLTASVGLASNKFLAKLASDMDKPNGLVVIGPEDIDRILPPLPVTRIWGVGKVTAAGLSRYGIKTIADLRDKSLDWLERHFGSDAQRYFNLARGMDDRPVISDREAKSIGHEQTFEVNIAEAQEILRVLLDQVEHVARRLRKHHLQARGVSLKIRYGDFKTVSRSATLKEPTDATAELWQAARSVFEQWAFEPVRLIGVTAERLSACGGQMSLFGDPHKAKTQKIDAVADEITRKFGRRAIRRGGAM